MFNAVLITNNNRFNIQMTSTPEPADQSHFLGKLEVLKEIRTRTVQLDKIKKKLTSEVEATVNEERCLDEYR